MRIWSLPSEVRRLEGRVRDLECMLGRKTMEVEILKGLPCTGKTTDLAVAIEGAGGYPVKRIG